MLHKEWVALVLMFWLATGVCAQDSIDDARQSIAGPPAGYRLPRIVDDRHYDGYGRWYIDNDNDFEAWATEICAYFALAVVTLPFTIPADYLNDEGQAAYFTEYPFADDQFGNLIIEPLWQPDLKTSRVRFGTQYGDNLDRQQKITTRLQFDTSNRYGLDASFDYLREQQGLGAHDQTWLGDINLTWRFAQSNQAEFRTGLGYNWQSDSGSSGGGFNFTYGGTFYLDHPGAVDFDLDLGQIGDASLTRITTSYSRYFKRAQVTVGYEYLRLGSFDANYLTAGVTLHY